MKLNTALETIFRLNKNQKKGLKKLGIFTISDLLYYFPIRYGDIAKTSYISDLKKGEMVNLYAVATKIKAKKSFRSHLAYTEAVLEEPSGDKINAIWFSQPYISKMLKEGELFLFSGNVSERAGKLYLANPEFQIDKNPSVQKAGSLFRDSEDDFKKLLFPVYKETRYITSKWIYHKIKKILANEDFLESLKDSIPENILKKYNLPTLKNAFFYLHLPKKLEDAEAAKKRFAFEEILFIHLIKSLEKKKYQESGSFVIKPEKKVEKDFLNSLDFELTQKQKEVLQDIKKDISSAQPMSRLLEGDVGSGKTIVAMLASLLTVSTKPKNQSFGKLQVAYMAPTEILATQVYKEFVEILGKKFGFKIALLTSKNIQKFPSKISKEESTKISKKKLLEWILNGEIQIVIGTHSLISKNVFFENLGLVIIDEQHRFGKNQRKALRAKPQAKKEKQKDQKSKKIIKKGLVNNDDILPHLLSMTATPIPRTLALSIYGDLDLSIMDELPKGRKKVITEIFNDIEDQREDVYKKAQKELQKGRQMYVICPRIFDADIDKERSLNVRSAVSTKEHLEKNKYFKKYKIGLLHSKLKKDEKEKVMQDFLDNKYTILVSTSVVEVGVSVANATVMIIEGAERFGLSQLHQFRGRVMRSTFQPYCYIFANAKTEKTLERLKALKEAKNGFELAEFDLQNRGAGQILGNKQSGVSDLAMEAIKNLKLVEFAQKEAKALVKDNKYKKYKDLNKRLKNIQEKIYLE